jgi:glycosyltransferase involved in cell wall biosynthesis
MRVSETGLISVIMPVWNGARYVREAVESVLGQNMNTEIIIVDDGSTDASLEVVADFACSVVSVPHSGIAKACNTGIARASGEYLLVLDQDDVMTQGALNTLYDEFVSDAGLHAVAARAKDFISPELDVAAGRELLPREIPYHGLMSGAMLLRRDVFNIVGGFNERYQAGQVVDFLLRVSRSGLRVKKLDFTAVMRRLHANNTGRSGMMKSKQFVDYGAILRAGMGKGAGNG